MTPVEVTKAVNSITAKLINFGICDDQNFTATREANSQTQVVYNGFNDVSIALRNVCYTDIYNHLSSNRQFNFKLIDGGLVQMLYLFDNKGNVIKHNLGYFPSPSFEPFQNDPDLYLDESNFYADMIQKSILPVPVRFDFDPDPEHVKDVDHPICHLTLGQYKNCRIPVVSPLCPMSFMSFVLRSFYNTATSAVALDFERHAFEHTITTNELRCLHLSIT